MCTKFLKNPIPDRTVKFLLVTLVNFSIKYSQVAFYLERLKTYRKVTKVVH